MISSFNNAVKPITGIDPNGLQIKKNFLKYMSLSLVGVTFYINEYEDKLAI